MDTNDCIVDVDKDKVSGSITTEKLTFNSDTTTCIGNACASEQGDPDIAPDGDLGEDAEIMDGPLYINIIHSSENLCIGPKC